MTSSISVANAFAGRMGHEIGAHGFLSLSLLTAMSGSILPRFDPSIEVNYGFDKVRFITPIKSGVRIRGRFMLNDFTWRSSHDFLTRYAVTVEIDGEQRSALVADWIVMTTLLEHKNEHTF